jgi:hypothetical protein
MTLLCGAFLAAETHQVYATKFYNSFHHRHTVLKRIQPGDVVTTRTIDASGRDENSKLVGEPSNPLTGPFYIEGAAPGDAIAVTFRRIRMNRDWGFSNYRLGLYSLTPTAIENLYPATYKEGAVYAGRSNAVPWHLDREKNTVRLREPASKVHSMEFAAARCSAVLALPPREISARVPASRDLTAATWTTTRSSKELRSCCPCTMRERCSSSAMATRFREMASRSATASRLPWT